MPEGSEKTRQFYDERGWREVDGRTVEEHLFHGKEDGPIRQELYAVHMGRVREALSQAAPTLDLLEGGCGGNPEPGILGLCSHYTGVDFSETGLGVAAKRLSSATIPVRLQKEDLCKLSFEDDRFDAVYSAHVLYHIVEPEKQAAALRELIRVVRPDGVVVLILANPRPLLFPGRLLKRLIADAPLLGRLADKLRPAPDVPYNPMTLGWMRRVVGELGDVEVVSHGLPSNQFNRNVTEYRGVGRTLWRGIRWLDLQHPRLSAHLGNYVQLTIRKRPSQSSTA